MLHTHRGWRAVADPSPSISSLRQGKTDACCKATPKASPAAIARGAPGATKLPTTNASRGDIAAAAPTNGLIAPAAKNASGNLKRAGKIAAAPMAAVIWGTARALAPGIRAMAAGEFAAVAATTGIARKRGALATLAALVAAEAAAATAAVAAMAGVNVT